MDMLPSSFQHELAEATAQFCAEHAPPSAIRDRDRDDEASALAPKVWLAAADLGFIGLSVPAEAGGHAQGLADHAMVFRELGRSLIPGPFVASVVATQLAVSGGEHELASQFVEGHELAGFALPRGGDLTAEHLSGRVTLVDAPNSGYIVAYNNIGAGLVRVSDLTDAKRLPCIDPGSRLVAATADCAPVACWTLHNDAPVLWSGITLAAAQLVGIAEACLDMTAEYAKTRVQFGQPIGVNQAVKHTCADMAVASDAALQQTLFAAICIVECRSDAQFHSRTAKFIAGRAAINNAGAGIQLHGGMGFTYEHDIHLYLARARVLDVLLGSGVEHLPSVLSLPMPE